MTEKLGFVALSLGFVTMTAVSGTVTDLPPDTTMIQWITLCTLALTGGLLSYFGTLLIKE